LIEESLGALVSVAKIGSGTTRGIFGRRMASCGGPLITNGDTGVVLTYDDVEWQCPHGDHHRRRCERDRQPRRQR
jgi:hypothetical protein